MIISFCGHSYSLFIDALEDKVLNEIEKVASGEEQQNHLIMQKS